MNHTPKHSLYDIKLKSMTNAIDILKKTCVFMHRAMAKRYKCKLTHCKGQIRKTIEDIILMFVCFLITTTLKFIIMGLPGDWEGHEFVEERDMNIVE